MQFNPLFILKSESLHIRPLKIGDFDSLFKAVSDPLTWEQTPYPDRYKPEVYQQWFDAAVQGNALIILDAKTKAAIGSSRYYDIEEVKGEVAIGYTFLNRDYWGGSTNKELKRLMLNHAFQSFEKVWLHIAKDNMRSRKAAEKVGATLSHTGQKNGLPYCWYELLK